MYRRDLPGNRNRIRHPERRLRNRPARPDQACFAGPGAHCTAHKPYRIPKILTSSTVTSFVRISANARHAGIHYQGLPKTLTLPKMLCHPRQGNDSRKPHRNRLGIKNPNAFRYLCTEGIWLCAADIPEKPHLSTEILHATTSCQAPRISPVPKVAQQNEISSSPGGLFDEFSRSEVPKNLTFDHFPGKFHSRKVSPVAGITACDRGPEKSHLKGIWAGKPAFPSRKTSPLGLHRPSQALLLCKMAVASRKSSHQTPVESRETSPFRKTA